MRRFVIWCCLFFTGLPVLLSQAIYLSSLDKGLFRLDIPTCKLDFVTQTDKKLFDITFHPDGTLYGITPDGELMRVDTNDGALSMVYDFIGNNFNSLTASAEGVIYAIGSDGDLWSYNPTNTTAVFHGNVGFPAAGDLTFRKGELYMAASGDRIVRIPLHDPSNSAVALSNTIQKDIFGIVSYAADCENITSYAITDGHSAVYAIDFLTGSLTPVCNLNIEIGGGASTYEFMGSTEMHVSIKSHSPSTCFENTGAVSFEVSGGSGILEYSIDGFNYSSSTAFAQLAGGAYTLYVIDSLGCSLSFPFVVRQENGPAFNHVMITYETCNADNGVITIQAIGGAAPLQYSLDDGLPQALPTFTKLTSGTYTIKVSDQTGCAIDTIVHVNALAPSFFTHVDVMDTRCDSANGGVIIQGATGALPFSYSVTGGIPQNDRSFYGLPAGSYFASITDRYGCEFTMPFTVKPSTTPGIEDIIIRHATCGGADGTVTIIALNQAQVYQYSLDGEIFQAGSSFKNLHGGDYIAYLQNFDGCIVTRSFSINASLGLEIDQLLVQKTTCGEQDGKISFEIENGVPPISAWLNNVNSGGLNVFDQLGAGEYLLLIEDNIGCTIDSSITIAAERCPLYVPNIFSPNGDGQNDYFSLSTYSGFDVLIKSYRIYDRWGSLLYAVKDFPVQAGDSYWWNGTVAGILAPGGVYAYHILIEYADGTSAVFTGDVTIVR